MANAAGPSLDASLALARLRQRLRGSSPSERASVTRVGAGLHADAEQQLLRLIPPQPKSAAVLVPVMDAPGRTGILLTVRAADLRQHPGQIAFPGGVQEAADEGPAAAALREAAEEVGLQPQDATVLGYMGDQIVLTGYRITPVVARIAPGFTPQLDAREVVESFVLPWEVLLDASHQRQQPRSIAGVEVMSRELLFGTHRIWGATASILFAVRDLVLE